MERKEIPAAHALLRQWILSPEEAEKRLDPLAPGLDDNLAGATLGALPYAALGGHGFERLCFELAVTDGKTPCLFGINGQKDLGVDLVINDAGRLTVMQCKNLNPPPAWSKIEDAVHAFEAGWLQRGELPRPERLIYCSPHPLENTKIVAPFLKYREEFRTRTGVDLLLQGRQYLDARLRRLPGLVASRFSAGIAEQFCGVSDWRESPWVQVSRGMERHKSVQRFIERHDRRRIYVSGEVEKQFEEVLHRGSVLLIQGLPGSGKTLTGLELASRLNNPPRPIYYATLAETRDIGQLWLSAQRRCNRPAVFVLDDCHVDFTVAESLMQRLDPELNDRRALLLLICRHVPSTGDEVADTVLTRTLEDDQLVITLRPGEAHTRAVIECMNPEFHGLSRRRLKRLHDSTGGDLMLLDEALEAISSPSDIDELQPEKLYSRLCYHYFGAKRPLPIVRRLAALAQFDLLPLENGFPSFRQSDEYRTASSLVSEVVSPPRYRFLHSSMAELVFRALAKLELPASAGEAGMLRLGIASLVEYFRWLLDESRTGSTAEEDVHRDLDLVLTTRLKLWNETMGARLKAGLLGDEAVQNFFSTHLHLVSFKALHVCVENLTSAGHPARTRYLGFVTRKLRFVLGGGEPIDLTAVQTIRWGLLTLRRHASEEWHRIQAEAEAGHFVRVLTTIGTVLELFRTLEAVTPEFAGQLLAHLDESNIEQLVARTIATGRRVGTLGLTLHEFRTERVLLAQLERAIGVDRMRRLLMANGSVRALFAVLQSASPAFCAQLLNLLDENTVEQLVARTIASGGSISTLGWAMSGLSQTDRSLSARLAEAFGPKRWLRLLTANGTVIDLFGALRYAPLRFAGQVLDHLDESNVEKLVDRAIASGQSIGGLCWAIRDHRQTDKSLLARLENAVGPERFLRLLRANGTVLNLFRILATVTPEFAGQLLERLDERTIEDLVTKAIASGSSIGMLGLLMRELGQADQALLTRLDNAIGPKRLARLLAANGTAYAMFKVLSLADIGTACRLVEVLDEGTVAQLVDRAIAAGSSLEAYHTLKRLARFRIHQERLQDLLGVGGWWHLYCSLGNLHSLTQLAEAMTAPFRERLIEAAAGVTASDWGRIILSSQFRNACDFIADELPAYPAEARAHFRAALTEVASSLAQSSTWFDLQSSHLPAAPGSTEETVLRRAFHQRMAAVQMDDLLGLEFREAVNAFSLCWRERPELRTQLGARLWDILPPQDRWPQKNGEISAIRLVLDIARSHEVSGPHALRLVDVTREILIQPGCLEIHTLPLFLLTWNLGALWRERGTMRSFRGALPEAALDNLCGIVQGRVNAKGPNPEKVAQLELAGLIGFLSPERQPPLCQILAPLEGSIRWLWQDVLTLTFVPGLFALEGMALLKPPDTVFSQRACSVLLRKASEYDQIGPAIEDLCARVRAYAVGP